MPPHVKIVPGRAPLERPTNMRANVYLSGTFWGALLIPGDSPLATLALGLANQENVTTPGFQLHPRTIDDVICTISLSLKASDYAPPLTTDTDP